MYMLEYICSLMMYVFFELNLKKTFRKDFFNPFKILEKISNVNTCTLILKFIKYLIRDNRLKTKWANDASVDRIITICAQSTDTKICRFFF